MFSNLKDDILMRVRRVDHNAMTTAFTIEAWGPTGRKITVYMDEDSWRVIVLRVWGPNVHDEMEEYTPTSMEDIEENIKWLENKT